VGQGDSILLDLGETEVLIDAGGRSPGITAYLEDYVDGALEAMIATHPHADHIGGLIAVLDAYEVENIWHNGDTSTSKTYSDFMEKVEAEDAEVREARRGDIIIADGLAFDVLHPGPLVDDTNNNSIVLTLSYGEMGFLFAGDTEHEAEGGMLVQSVVPILDIDILKVGHHGSRTSSSRAFLDIIQPEVAIYMAGIDNRYGHPHAETISALRDVGGEVYGTDTYGTIIVGTDGETSAITFTLTSAGISTAEPSSTYRLPKGQAGSKLEVYVGGTLWKRVENLSDFGPNDRVYVVVEDSEGQSNIRFGDGKHGARLPSASNNVAAIYLLGGSADGARFRLRPH
jgi:beta-lactamase superfamily II metal-dependent hydrolase